MSSAKEGVAFVNCICFLTDFLWI